jgi:hypothetical protein
MAIDTVKKHAAWIMERGGERRVHEITEITKVQWSRVRDDISVASVVVAANQDSDQAPALRQLVGATGRYELCIWRDGVRVWEGPITLVTFNRERVTIQARDVLHYTARMFMSKEYDNSYSDGVNRSDFVINRMLDILTYEFERRDTVEGALGLPSVNVLPYVVDHQTPTDARTARKTLPYQYEVFEHLDDMAAKGGMDYCTVGRAIHLWDTSKPAMGYTPMATERDFLGELYVSVYGMELGTVAAVSDGQGNVGIAGAADPYYGLVERLDTAYDEDASQAPTQSELESQAQRNVAGRNPTPLQVRIPDNSSVALDGVFSVENLVPGVYIPLLCTIGIVEVSQMQKLNTMKVTEDPNGETVTVTLFPASSPDEEEEEE